MFHSLAQQLPSSGQDAELRDRNFEVAASVHFDATGDQNFVQMGGLSDTFGRWKVEIFGTQVHCRIAGTTGVASIWFWGVGPPMEKGFHTSDIDWATLTYF
jgi:hypothetical protein